MKCSFPSAVGTEVEVTRGRAAINLSAVTWEAGELVFVCCSNNSHQGLHFHDLSQVYLGSAAVRDWYGSSEDKRHCSVGIAGHLRRPA